MEKTVKFFEKSIDKTVRKYYNNGTTASYFYYLQRLKNGGKNMKKSFFKTFALVLAVAMLVAFSGITSFAGFGDGGIQVGGGTVGHGDVGALHQQVDQLG